jgi:ABC-type transport system substrate-binding protein
MKKIRMCFKTVIFVCFLVAGLGLCLAPSNARAEIKEIKIGIGIDADTLHPQEHTTSLPINICELICDTLFYQTADLKLEPRLATNYELSKDGLTYTVHLRKGVKFSDGMPFNAQAMKLTFDRALNRKEWKTRVPLHFTIAMIEEVTIVDDYTIQIKLKYPFAPFGPTLSMVIASPLSPTAIFKYGEDVRRKPVGAGPYVLKEWVAGDRIVLVRNESYYGKRPTVAKLTFKIVPETATREAMLRTGQIDICYKPLPSDVAALKADPNITVEMPLDTRTIFMGLNCQKGVTTNKLVRQAFNYAVDKKAIVKKILFNTAEPMSGTVSPILFGYQQMDHQYDYNPEKAKELLKKANFDFSQTDWPTYVAGLLKPIDKSELEVFLLGWGPMILDADMALSGQFTCAVNPPKGLGSAFYCNLEYDKMMTASREEQDTAKRKALLVNASKIIWDDCPWIWLHVEKFVLAYSSKIKGLVVSSTERFYPTYVTME